MECGAVITTKESGSRRRLTREARFAQLIEVSWHVIRQKGTAALTLSRLAAEAGVSKPVVYDHFSTRHALLAALYKDFDTRQTEMLDGELVRCAPTLEARVAVFSRNYIGCILCEGREVPELIAALQASPELLAVRRACLEYCVAACRVNFTCFTSNNNLPNAVIWAILGAGDGLSNAVLDGAVGEEEAYQAFYNLIMCQISRA